MEDAAPPRRGDKFAALQQQQQQQESKPSAPKRDKFAAMQSRNNDAVTSLPSATSSSQPLDPQASKAARMQKAKFNQVWNDLQLAEAATLRLLQLARDTAECLGRTETLDLQDNDNDDNEDSNRIQQPPVDEFIETLRDIHARLSPHAHYVKAYQAPTEPNKTYLAKMELGLARQKRDLVHDWNALLKGQDGGLADSGGKPVASMAGATAVGSKRKRDDDE